MNNPDLSSVLSSNLPHCNDNYPDTTMYSPENATHFPVTPYISSRRIVHSGEFLSQVELDLVHPTGEKSVYEMTERISEKVF